MARKKKRDNKKLFDYCKTIKDDLLDDAYKVEKIVITKDKKNANKLMKCNDKLISLITTYQTLKSSKKKGNSTSLNNTFDEIYELLLKNEGINQSAFCQYWVTRNISYSKRKSLKDKKEQKSVLSRLLNSFIKERHAMYSSHGYTSTILQVVSDNYSQKRKGSVGINKYKTIIEGDYNYKNIKDGDLKKGINWNEDKIVFYPDKSGKKLFDKFVEDKNLSMHSRDDEHNKKPDIVFHRNDQRYIIELKNMKEGGGGQNKQIVEIANFIKYSEPSKKYHYITILDGAYWDEFTTSQQPKVVSQRTSVEKALKNNKANYFVNSLGAKELFKNIL